MILGIPPKVGVVADQPESHPESIRASISREIVAVLKQTTGRGPTKARTDLLEGSVLVILRHGHTRSEETMFGGGHELSVAESRVGLSETMREPLVEVIERNVDRKVVAFMSSSHQHPDLISFVFVLETSPLLAVVEGDG